MRAPMTPETAATTSAAAAPTAEALIVRAQALLPAIRAAAEANERARMVAPAIVAQIREAGLLRVAQPARFGGYGYGNELILQIAIAFAAACPSTAWCTAIALGHQWLLAGFPLAAQRDVWDENPDAFICGSYAPAGKAVSCEGGYRLSGRFGFTSGCDHATWAFLAGFVAPLGAAPREPSFFLVPACDYRIDDDWHTSGLAGTGSKTVVVTDAFVPAHRRLSFADTTNGDTPGARAHDDPNLAIPLLAFFPALLAATAVGAAKGALAEYITTMRGRETRGAIAGGQARIAEFATTQLRVAEAAAASDTAELILLSDAREIAEKARRGERLAVADRIRYRRGQAYATKLAIEAVETLNAATGGKGLFLDNLVQRAWRDANAVGRHISLNWDAVGTMYGQHALGLEPLGQY